MSTPRDDDALSWGGDDDPTLDIGDKRQPESDVEPEPLVPEPRPEPLAPRATEGAAVPEPPASVDSRSASVREPEPTASVDPVEKEAPDADRSAPLGNVGLVGIGVVAATSIFWALGWLVAGRQLQSLGIPIPDVTVVAMTIGAALAPLVWFVAVLVLTRSWRTWQRFLLLVLGLVLLVPWPFLSLGSFA